MKLYLRYEDTDGVTYSHTDWLELEGDSRQQIEAWLDELLMNHIIQSKTMRRMMMPYDDVKLTENVFVTLDSVINIREDMPDYELDEFPFNGETIDVRK